MSKSINQIASEIQQQLREEGLPGEVNLLADSKCWILVVLESSQSKPDSYTAPPTPIHEIMERNGLTFQCSAAGEGTTFFSYQLNPG